MGGHGHFSLCAQLSRALTPLLACLMYGLMKESPFVLASALNVCVLVLLLWAKNSSDSMTEGISELLLQDRQTANAARLDSSDGLHCLSSGAMAMRGEGVTAFQVSNFLTAISPRESMQQPTLLESNSGPRAS